jgi:hypothetical protein
MNDKRLEPMAYLCENAVGHKYFRWKKPPSTYKPIALYTLPSQHEWVGLTEDDLVNTLWPVTLIDVVRLVEAMLKEKNAF